MSDEKTETTAVELGILKRALMHADGDIERITVRPDGSIQIDAKADDSNA